MTVTFKTFLESTGDLKDLEFILRDNCKEACQIMNASHRYFFRGTNLKNLNGLAYKVGYTTLKTGFSKPRKDRVPRDTPKHIHEVVNNYFQEKFGFKARSEGLFITTSASDASHYGNLVMVFPYGSDWKTLWSATVSDLTTDLLPDIEYDAGEFDANDARALPGGIDVWRGMEEYDVSGHTHDVPWSEQQKFIQEFLDSADYQFSKPTEEMLNSGNEMVLDCNGYFMIACTTSDALAAVMSIVQKVAND